MAAGDIISVTIPARGDQAEILIEGVGTGGTYDLGLGTDNDPANAKVVFTVVSKGFDDAGNATTITRTVYGTKFVRKVYPNQAQADETVSGSDVIVRVWLSDYIYAKDKSGAGNSGTNPVVNITSGVYTQGGTPSGSAIGPATNNSTYAYHKPVANWIDAQFQRFTGNVQLAVCAFERHGKEHYQRPVRMVRFTISDESLNSTDQDVTASTATGSPDQQPVIKYSCDVAQTAFTQGQKLKCRFRVYPWVGDVILDSDDGVNTGLTPKYSNQEHLCDKNGTYGVTVALVDPAGSDSGANTVYDEASFNPATAYKFLTIGKAAAAIASYNNTNRSRNDVGAGIVYLNAGNYSWLGSVNAYGVVPKTNIIIQPAPGVARADVVINNESNDHDISDRVCIRNVTITANPATNCFSGILSLWFDQCHFNTASTTLWNTSGGLLYFTHCRVQALGIGLGPPGITTQFPALVRGCDLTGFTGQCFAFTVVGNKKTGKVSGTSLLVTEITGIATEATGYIIAFNALYGFDSASPLLSTGGIDLNTHGCAIVQNLFEHCGAGGPLASIASSDSDNTNLEQDNHIIWHNTFVGNRVFMGYNDATTLTKHRRGWSQFGNYFDRWANKGDTFSPEHANRFGAWPVANNVGSRYNQLAQNMVSLPGNFFAEFAGVNCHQPAASEALTYPNFVNRQSSDGTSGGAGDGDYNTNAGSPLRNYVKNSPLIVDLQGRTRGVESDAGAFTAGGGRRHRVFIAGKSFFQRALSTVRNNRRQRLLDA